MKTLRGVIRGKMIVLEEEPELPEGQEVTVAVQAIATARPAETRAPRWLARLEVNEAVKPGKLVIKGTVLLADELVARLAEGRDDEQLLRTHPELTREDMDAVHEYAKLPVEMRRSFGAWAESAEELDKYLEWNRQQRKVPRRRIED